MITTRDITIPLSFQTFIFKFSYFNQLCITFSWLCQQPILFILLGTSIATWQKVWAILQTSNCSCAYLFLGLCDSVCFTLTPNMSWQQALLITQETLRCDWPQQRDTGSHFSKRSICFNFCHKAFVNSPCGPHLLKCTIATLKRNGRTGGLAETPDVIWMRPYSFPGWLALINQMEIAGCDHDFLINSARQRSWIAELVSINKESSKTSPCATLKLLHKTL